MQKFLKVMKALSDPNRVLILKMLQEKTMCVREIQTALGIAQPTVSKHLKILGDVGLVSYRKEGLWVNYSITDGNSCPYATCLLDNLGHWLEDDRSVTKIRKDLKSLQLRSVG